MINRSVSAQSNLPQDVAEAEEGSEIPAWCWTFAWLTRISRIIIVNSDTLLGRDIRSVAPGQTPTGTD